MIEKTPQTRRVNRGRNHSYILDDVKVNGVTRWIDEGFPKPGLINWAANVTVDMAEDRWDELVELKPSERRKMLERARWDHRDPAAKRGTDAHALIQRLARGEEVEPPEQLVGFVDAYLRFVDEWQPRELLVEAPVFSREYGYAGTLDVVAQLADGQTWLLDWKTGAKGIFSEAAVQLSAYKYCDFVLGPDGTELPMPRIDQAGCVWIRDDSSYALIPVDAGPDTFAVFGAVQLVARFRTEMHVIGDEIPPPSPDGKAPA
jgi:hypothetical protein